MSNSLFPAKQILRAGLTVTVVILAWVLVSALWRAYVLAPWTRDGRVSAQIVRIAPEVSGTVLDVSVVDDQFVKQGEVLYRIGPAHFALALAQAEAQLAVADVSLRQKMEDARRIAQAELRSAQVAVDRAKLDMEHTVLRAPVDGYITRLRLSKGDYAVTGQPNIALVDASSFRIIGYFEETKLHGIEPGASAQIRLMGFDDVIPGRVVSIGRGIADANQQADAQGLPSVAPSFSWVRLAQRIPVRVEFGQLPQNLVLAAGMTGSIEVTAPGGDRPPQGRLATLLQRWL